MYIELRKSRVGDQCSALLSGGGFGGGGGVRLGLSDGGESGLFFERPEIALFAALDEAFGHGFQLLPACADVVCFSSRDLVVGDGGGDDSKEVGEFLDNFVGGGDQKFGMGIVGLRIFNEETAGALANPLDETRVAAATLKGVNAIEGIDGATASGCVGRLGPFVDHGEREAQLGGNLLGAAFLENFAQEFVRLHGQKMTKRRLKFKV